MFVYYIVFVYCFCTCMRNGGGQGGALFCVLSGGGWVLSGGIWTGNARAATGGILSASVCQKMGIPATGALNLKLLCLFLT